MQFPDIRYTSPTPFSLRQRATLMLLPPLITGVIRLNHHTHRRTIIGEEHYTQALAVHGNVLLAFWHEMLGMAVTHYAGLGYHTLTSYSYDGELIARIVRWSGLEAVRGSSTRGGSEGLKGLVAAANHGTSIGLTLDGPKGPRRVSKAGMAVLSARTQVPILPNAFMAAPAWRANSWDRFCVAKPFARVVCAYGPAIAPPADETEEAVEAVRVETERSLAHLTAQVEAELGIAPESEGRTTP